MESFAAAFNLFHYVYSSRMLLIPAGSSRFRWCLGSRVAVGSHIRGGRAVGGGCRGMLAMFRGLQFVDLLVGVAIGLSVTRERKPHNKLSAATSILCNRTIISIEDLEIGTSILFTVSPTSG